MNYRRYTTNRHKPHHGAAIEIIIGAIAWLSVCAVSWWALAMMLELYTTN